MAAVVDLEEGPRMWMNIVDWDDEALRIGMRVEVVFREQAPGVSVAVFRPG